MNGDDANSGAVISLRDVYRTYEMGDFTLNALDGVSVDIQKNEYVAIIGSSGSGKSTMMNIIGCLDRATRGNYQLNGRNVGDMNEAELAAFFKQGRPAFHPDNERKVDMPPKGGNPTLNDEDLRLIAVYVLSIQ